MTVWSVTGYPSQTGKIAVITGATGGLGLETALGLAGAGAEVVAHRPQRGQGRRGSADDPRGPSERRRQLRVTRYLEPRRRSAPSPSASPPDGQARHPRQQRRRHGAARTARDRRRLRAPVRHQLPRPLRPDRAAPAAAQRRARRASCRSPASRRATARSISTTSRPKTATGRGLSTSQSKLACLMFALELQRRSTAGGWGITSVAAHPGVSSTDLIENGMGAGSLSRPLKPLLGLFFQSPADGALPQLFAATMPGVAARRLLRSRWLHGAPRQAEARDAGRAGARRGGSRAALGYLGAADRAALPAAQGCGVNWRRDRHRSPLPARAQTGRTAAPPRGHPRGGGGAVRRRRSAGRRPQRHRGQGRLHQVQPLPLFREPRGRAPQPLP